MEPYQTIKSEKTYTGKIVDVYQDIISLPNGKTTLREVVIRGEAACIIPVDPEGNVVLVKQYRHPVKKITLEIPAGVMEDGEEPEKCAVRELLEETGYKAEEVKFLTEMYSAIGFCTEKIYIYAAKIGMNCVNQNLDSDEFVEVVKIPLKKAVQMVFDGEIIDAKTITAILMYNTSFVS